VAIARAIVLEVEPLFPIGDAVAFFVAAFFARDGAVGLIKIRERFCSGTAQKYRMGCVE
jgi:hypothetical protein